MIAQGRRHTLRHHCGYRRTGHAPSQRQNAKQIKHYVQDRGKKQKPKRRLAVTQSTDDAGEQIVKKRAWHTDESDKQIEICILKYVFRRTHGTQDESTKQTRDHGYHDRHDSRQF